MKRNLMISLFLLTVLTMSCTRLILHLVGGEKPKLETTRSIQDFLISIECFSNTFYIAKDSNALMQLIKFNKRYPNAEFFDSNGFILPYNEDQENTCNAGVDSFINHIAANKIISTRLDNIQARLNCIINAHTQEEINFYDLPRSDYYVIFYFAKWLGNKVNKEHLTPWVNYISSLDEGKNKITYLILSADYMSNWGMNTPKIRIKTDQHH